MNNVNIPENIPQVYLPDKFFRDLVLVKGNLILFLYYALLADLKPMLDDWILPGNIKLFEKVCRHYGLFVSKESLFVNMPLLDIERSIGKEDVTTTKNFCVPFNSNYSGSIHVFVSKSKKTLDEGKGYGWYSLVTNGRAIRKPSTDHYRFGEFLGYPKCCMDFFWKYNNHSKYENTLNLPFKNTKKPNFLCNSLTKDSYSYLYHIPCSFGCKKTIKLSSELRDFIYNKDKRYGQIIDQCMKKIFLVFREKDIYGFEGSMQGNEVYYNNCYFLDYMLYTARYLESFKKGNHLKVTDESIIIYLNGKMIKEIRKDVPEVGFLISFSD